MTAPVEAPSTDTTEAPGDTPLGDVVGRDVLEARAKLLEQAVIASGKVSPADIDAVRPGGAGNADTSAHGWLHFLCTLHRMHERTGVAVAANAARWDPDVIEATRAALAAEPIHLTLADGTPVAVHPKSEHALHRLVLIDVALNWTVVRRVAIETLPPEQVTPQSLTALRTAIDLQTQLEREFVTVVCCPGADVPASASGDSAWDIPLAPWSATLDPLDIMAIRKAHLEVNYARIQMIADRTRSYADGEGSNTPVAAFLGIMASELGVQPMVLARRWSLGEVFAQALLRWEAMKKAEQDAKDKQDK